MEPDRRVDEYASRQYGVLTRRQAERAGCSDTMIQGRLDSGAWVKLTRGVYAVASAPPKWERQVSAAVLSREHAMVAGSTAAVLHGFEGFRRGRPEILVPMGASARSDIARITRSTWFGDIGAAHVLGFPTMNAAETTLAVAPRVEQQRLERLVDDQIVSGGLSVEDFEGIRRRVANGRVRGAGALFPILDERATDAWEPPVNELEAMLGRLTEDPSIPPASRQTPFGFDRLYMVVDLYIPRWRLILEADGRRWHSRRADFERDRARDNAAAAAGLVVLRFTWRMLKDDFDDCRRTLLQTGAARARTA